MIDFKQNRRSIVVVAWVLTVIVLGIGQAVLQKKAEAQRASPQGYVLSAAEGEHLMRSGGNIFIKADPSRGSKNMALTMLPTTTGASTKPPGLTSSGRRKSRRSSTLPGQPATQTNSIKRSSTTNRHWCWPPAVICFS